jgi:hypothetical protein
MINPKYRQIRARLVKCVKDALPQGTKTALWLLKITIPVSFGVFLFDYSGWMNMVAGWTAPLFSLIGLSGEASIILITSIFTNIYSAIAVMTTLGTGYREGTILAVMCLISHALIVETAIQRKTGSNPWRMVLTRLSASLLAAFLLNRFLPGEMAGNHEVILQQNMDFIPALKEWLRAISVTTLKILVLVNLLLILQKILSEFGLIKWILKPFKPLLLIMGLPPKTGFLWMVAYTLGLSYGGAIMISQSEEGHLAKEEADLLNHHIAISHSILEDTLLFAAMGYNLAILVFPRILLSVLYVWFRKIEIRFRGRHQGNTETT